MTPRATLVLADRPTTRPALVTLAAAIEGSAVADRVDVVLASGLDEIADAGGRALRAGHAVAVAWSFLSCEADAAAAELAAVRAGLRGPALHVAGGAHASAEPEGTLSLGFDLAARGEGEATLIAVMTRLLDGGDVRSAPGLWWRAASGLGRSARPAPVSLDDHPPSSRRLGKALALEITRGCVWACRFCQTPFLHRASFRHRSIASARRWARHAVELGHRDLRFLTPSALSYGAERDEVRLEAVDALLAAVREEAGPARRIFFGTFPSELRPEHVSPAALGVLRRWIDNRDLLVGAQSGSDRLLDELGRGHRSEDVVRAARVAAEAGFRLSVDFILGLPGETEEDREASRRIMERLARTGARLHAHAFLPLPGTPLRDARPGAIDAPTRRLLGTLASRGLAYGSWRGQERLGRALARSRS